jgi:hypothetical protein
MDGRIAPGHDTARSAPRLSATESSPASGLDMIMR